MDTRLEERFLSVCDHQKADNAVAPFAQWPSLLSPEEDHAVF
jgi:hypothetical protein